MFIILFFANVQKQPTYTSPTKYILSTYGWIYTNLYLEINLLYFDQSKLFDEFCFYLFFNPLSTQPLPPSTISCPSPSWQNFDKKIFISFPLIFRSFTHTHKQLWKAQYHLSLSHPHFLPTLVLTHASIRKCPFRPIHLSVKGNFRFIIVSHLGPTCRLFFEIKWFHLKLQTSWHSFSSSTLYVSSTCLACLRTFVPIDRQPHTHTDVNTRCLHWPQVFFFIFSSSKSQIIFSSWCHCFNRRHVLLNLNDLGIRLFKCPKLGRAIEKLFFFVRLGRLASLNGHWLPPLSIFNWSLGNPSLFLLFAFFVAAFQDSCLPTKSLMKETHTHSLYVAVCVRRHDGWCWAAVGVSGKRFLLLNWLHLCTAWVAMYSEHARMLLHPFTYVWPRFLFSSYFFLLSNLITLLTGMTKKRVWIDRCKTHFQLFTSGHFYRFFFWALANIGRGMFSCSFPNLKTLRPLRV